MKFGCSIGIFLNTSHLICRSTDISKCFRGSLRLRDNESRLYSDFLLSSEMGSTLQGKNLNINLVCSAKMGLLLKDFAPKGNKFFVLRVTLH